MEQDKGYAAARAKTSGRPAREKQPGNAQCNGILAEYRRSLAGFTWAVWPLAKCVALQILADKGYDSDKFVRWIKERGGIPVIPSRNSARQPRETDWHTYKERHLIENLFLKLKNHRRFSTRYEKKAVCFHTVVSLACILLWLIWGF